MKHEYITHYEVWQNGVVTSYGNQAISIESDSPPNARQFYEAMKNDAVERAGCTYDQVRIISIFKL